jgi:glycosyltransferase involved in cell wall biosynthesis
MTDKKKILYIITKSNWGGAQRYVFDLAKSFKNECEISVASGGNGILFDKLRAEGIKTISIPFLGRDIKIWDEPKVLLETLKILKQEKPTIVHLNGPKVAGIGAVASRIYNFSHKGKIKIVQTVHGFSFIEPRPFIWRTIMWLASYVSLLLTHKSIFVSKKDMRLSKKMFFVSKKITYIPNGISPINFLPREESRLKLLGNQYDGILIGTIAELSHNKGLEFLINSFSYLKDEHIQSVIIGDGEKREELRQLKDKLNAPVTFTGLLPGAGEYLKVFDVFVLPSLKEGLPYVIIEAGFAGLPVISTTVGGIPHLIESGVSGTLIPPKDSKALAFAIELYLQNPSLREMHGKKLNEIVKENFSLEQMVEKTRETYNL